ncbi:MAG: FecR domain-containing protein [Bacteroidota bacterium]
MKNDELLHKWVNDELSEAEEESFRERPEYTALQRLREVTEKMHAPELQQEALLQNILQTPKAKVRQLSRRWLLAAAAVVGLAIAAWFLLQPPPTTQFATVAGQRLEKHLPDASFVVLNAASNLTYSPDDWPANRQLELTGEAYFDVAKGSTFTVNTDVGQVEVLGTQFNVWSREGQLEVSCYEGRVAVRFAANDFDEVIQAGQAVRLQPGSPAQYWNVKPEQVGDHLLANGSVRLDSVPLSRVIMELEFQFDITIKPNRVDTTTIVSTTFPTDDLEQALRIVFNSLPIRYEIVSSKQVNLYIE